MILVAPNETYIGMSMMLRALNGEKITFTRFKIGNGTVNEGNDVKDFTDLVNPLIEFGITSIDKPSDNTMVIEGGFNTSVITEDFRCREIGLFCKGEDDVEVLYAYAFSGEEAGMLKKNTSGVTATQRFAFSITLSSSANITAVLTEATIYITKEEFEEHVNATNPHGITAKDVDLENVPNVATNDQTPTYELAKQNSELVSGEKISVAFGKMARVVKSFLAHLSNKNPHKLDCKTIGASEKEHEHSAADITEGVLGVLRGGTGVQSYSGLNKKLIVCGTYIGDGSSSQHINIGTRPRAVLIMDYAGRTNYVRDGKTVYCGGLAVEKKGVAPDNDYYLNKTAYSLSVGYTVATIYGNGFAVCNGSDPYNVETNSEGIYYNYIAIL